MSRSGCAQACAGVTLAIVSTAWCGTDRPSGQQYPPHAGRNLTDDTNRQACMEDRIVFAVDGQQQRATVTHLTMKQRADMTSASLLANNTRLPRRALPVSARDRAAPTMAAHDVVDLGKTGDVIRPWLPDITVIANPHHARAFQPLRRHPHRP